MHPLSSPSSVLGLRPHAIVAALLVFTSWINSHPVQAQPYGRPDRGAPGDRQIQAYLAAEADRLHSEFAFDLTSREQWESRRPRLLEEYFHMLGLWPLPERTPLSATITGTYEGDGFHVDMLHYQSMPGLYATANLYRPAVRRGDERFPAVLYVCGHSHRGRSGNKTAFQSHGIWFARHGYVCLVVDTLQLGEIAALHHGTYREGRWWWYSRGYTPAGVECWNGIRGIDYLVTRDDVDPNRLAVTGISGGGAATFWVACGDPRVQVAVPVSGMADLPSYVTNRVVNGHCDCMFLYNTFQWPWTRIAALLAPRPTLFVNSDQDAIFPMDANERISNRLERFYSQFGAGDQFDTLVSIGGHAYRQDIRQGVARFINTHLQNRSQRVLDTEVDVIGEEARSEPHPIPPERLRVFPRDEDLPRDQRNTTIDETFVPQAVVALPSRENHDRWKRELKSQLRRVTFGALADPIPAARSGSGLADEDSPASPGNAPDATRPDGDETGRIIWLQTEANLQVRLRQPAASEIVPSKRDRIVLVMADRNLEEYQVPAELGPSLSDRDLVFMLESRGIGASRWTDRNPPNYIRRSHVLLGRTVDTGRVWDVAATARYLRDQYPDAGSVWVAGSGSVGICAAYAGLWEDSIQGVWLLDPPATHMDAAAPSFLNILRVCDLPEALGLLAPKPLTLIETRSQGVTPRVKAIYQAAEASESLRGR